MINVTVGEQKTQENEYPKLMKANANALNDDGIIVLFTQKEVGVVLKTTELSHKRIGYYSRHFNMGCFEYLNEELKLQNA